MAAVFEEGQPARRHTEVGVMQRMQRQTRAVGVAVVVLVALGLVPAAAQETGNGWTVSRTSDGQPDLQGVWANNSVTPLERPEVWAGKTTLTDEELAELKAAAAAVTANGLDAQFGDQLVLAALAGISDADSYDTTGNYNQFWLADRNFDHDRTSLVIAPADGKIPPLTSDAERVGRGVPPPLIAPTADSWTDRPLSERCLTFGVPNLLAGYNSYYQIIQGSDHVVIFMEMMHDARIIPLDGTSHVSDAIRQLHGDSRGHWEGDTLVVETTNYSALGRFWNAGEQFRLIERFTRVGPDTLHHEITFDDQTTWTSPWTILIPLTHSVEPIFEYACHEGNIGMEGILSGYRAEERQAASAASR